MVLLTTSSQTLQPINRLYVFGDSLSDVGNVYKATGGAYPPNPPYYRGRYSNGPVWVEHLASRLALRNQQIINTAYGGATTGSGSINGIPGVLAQVGEFTKNHPKASRKTLHVLWAGANDYLNGATNPTMPIANLSKAIETLAQTGAQTILVGNLPDLGNLPATRNSAYAKALTGIAIAHNNELAKALTRLRQNLGSDVQIIEFDTYGLYQTAIAKPGQFGFTNVTSACTNNQATCDNADQFLFWDGIHPTAATHRILGERALSAITSTSSAQERQVLK